jgi:GNAT superfamily N-acetyltransferase
MADWNIRRAEMADAASLAACIEAAYSIYAASGVELPAVSDGIAEDIRDNLVWVAVQGGRIVGGLVLVAKQDHMMLANVAVDPGATGAGLGRALIQHAEREARELGVHRMKLTTHAGMPENVRLYEHLGWRETGRCGDKVFMEKQMAP